jgi:soluble lytic murein transglycosylase
MTLRFFGTAFALLVLLGAAYGTTPGGQGYELSSVSDSALDELAVGRFWHAARMLRAEGAAEGSPVEVLTLARAEAGWENWPAVLELLEGALDSAADDGEAAEAGPAGIWELEGGLGTYLLGRALEQAERWDDASVQYGLYVDLVGAGSPEGLAALARRARAAWRSDNPDLALSTLSALVSVPSLRSWAAAELVLTAADDGNAEAVRAWSTHVVDTTALGVVWRAEADALLNSGDSVAAATEFRSIRNESSTRRAVATVELALLSLAAGDTAGARPLLVEGVDAARGASRTRAAGALLELGDHGFDRTLELARILDRAGDGTGALSGYDRARSLAEQESAEFPETSRLDRARIMATVRARQNEALEEFRAIRETTESEVIGARNLDAWAELRDRQGMSAQVNTLRRWLLEEYPTSGAAAEVAYSQGSNAESRGALDQALERYKFLTDNARTHTRAGQARMRSGQIHLRRSDLPAAAEVFELYLEDFPNGRRWQEAAYWAGRTRMQLGDSADASRHLRHVLSQPVEYYAVMAAELLDERFAVDVPPGTGAEEPAWLTEGLERLDLLVEAGLERGASSEVARLRERAADVRGPKLRLAQALIERGRTIDGINLGWALLEDAGSWDQQILRVAYPFPYRELVRREAEEWGVDPYMMAAIIRQESAFKADIVSRAGAIGLMQVMPPTGAQLARTHGPTGFTDESLTKPEVNLHLGAAFFVDMSRRYDDELPLVLSAYNAGPTRATRWRRYPEAADPLRFTERIPFVETRGYVKSVRRNVGLYRAIYGQD